MRSKLAAIIQARRSSTRFHDKIFKKIGDRFMIDHVIDRVKEAGVENIIIATSHMDYDSDIIEDVAVRNGVNFSAWQYDWNVLSRFVKTCKEHDVTDVIRVCSDNPFLNPEALRHMVDVWKLNDFDYLGYWHGDKPAINQPLGVFAEIVKAKSLEIADEFLEVTQMPEREHVTKAMVDGKFGDVPRWLPSNYKGPNLSVDTKEDLRRVSNWYAISKY